MNTFFIIIAILCFTLLLVYWIKASSLKKQNAKLKLEKEKLVEENLILGSQAMELAVENDKLKYSNAELSVYDNALNADNEAKERLKKAKQEAELLIQNANKEAEYVMFNSQSRAKDIIEQANEKVSFIAATKNSENKSQKRGKVVAADIKKELITKIDFEVSGLYYRGEEAIEEVQQLISGDLLHFLHEQTNKSDRYAMKVLTDNGVFIGYVEKSFSRIFFEHQQDFIECVVTYVKEEYKVPYVHAQVRYYGNVEGLEGYNL